MKEIDAARFKKRCLSILDSIDEEGILVTKNGVPVAKVIPIRAKSTSLIGSLKHKVRVASPKDELRSTGIKWGAES